MVKIKQIAGVIIFVFLFFCYAESQTLSKVSDAQKEDFIKVLKTLPHKGEFFTDEAINKSEKSLPILFAFNEKDLSKYDIYPFVVLSGGLADRKIHQDYAVKHFSEIQHPILKLFWGAMLFNKNVTSPEIVKFLQDALKSETQIKILTEMLGPNYKDFQRRVNNCPVKITQ